MTLRTLRHACCGALAVAAVSGAATARAATHRVEFTKDVLPLARATDHGRAAPSRTMEIGIALKAPHRAAEDRLAAAQENPASAQYHRFLTPAGFQRRFAVRPAAYASVLRWLRSGGAKVQATSPSRDYVEVRATVAQVDRVFATRIHAYSARGTSFLANRYSPSVPAGLRVLDVVGLNTLQHPTTPLYGVRARTKAARAAALPQLPGVPQVKLPVPSAGTPTPGELTPQDMWSIYDLPRSDLGDGQSVAVIGEGQTSTVVSALRTFENHHGLAHVPAVVTRAPSVGDYSDTGGNVEWELDTQAATGMAPHAKQVHLYFGQHLIDPDVESALTAWVSDPHGPRQANASFGECETTPANATLENPLIGQFNNDGDYHAMFGTDAPDDLEPVAEQTLLQATLEGRTLFSSTGDTGSSCPVLVLGPLGAGNGVANEGVPLVNYPAASRYAVAVGGSVLYSDGGTPPKRGLEYPWPYTGGGQSFFLAEPSFQRGDAAVNRPCVSDRDGNTTNTGVTCRGIPDVASESGDIATSSYTIYSPELGGDSSEGGTSLSSPLWAGMWTRIQAASARGTGFANYPIYRTAENATRYARDFTDLQVGTNGAYQAAAGWDYVSGWGVPDVAHLMQDVDGRLTPVG
jgi:pseudomonalisin